MYQGGEHEEFHLSLTVQRIVRVCFSVGFCGGSFLLKSPFLLLYKTH
ncbi:hypothetical protein BN132_3375 [Cronobacter turicensis 564]|nr:hypothetical protein BN132_3375 [Cronobacter turicensis 564]